MVSGLHYKVRGERRIGNAQELQQGNFLLNSMKIMVPMTVVKCRKRDPEELGNLHLWRCSKLHLTDAKGKPITAGPASRSGWTR